MATTPTVYVICDQNCKFEGMTKEQILTAIVNAVSSGEIGDVNTGFVQTIKTINGKALKFFVGEQHEYDALSEGDKQDLFAIITNDTTKDSLLDSVESLTINMASVLVGTKSVGLAREAVKATTATRVEGVPNEEGGSRHVWFSSSLDETQRVYNDNFKYNPVTGTLFANKLSGTAELALASKLVNASVVSTDILAKAISVAQETRTPNGMWAFSLSGDSYADAENLPSATARYGKALVLVRYDAPTVVLFDDVDQTIYYNNYYGGEWQGWQTIVGKKTLWTNGALIIGESTTGFMKANVTNSLDLSAVATELKGKWLVAAVRKLVAQEIGGVDVYSSQYRFKTCAFWLSAETASYSANTAFTQNIDGTNLTFWVNGSTLYYMSSESGFYLDAIYEEM